MKVLGEYIASVKASTSVTAWECETWDLYVEAFGKQLIDLIVSFHFKRFILDIRCHNVTRYMHFPLRACYLVQTLPCEACWHRVVTVALETTGVATWPESFTLRRWWFQTSESAATMFLLNRKEVNQSAKKRCNHILFYWYILVMLHLEVFPYMIHLYIYIIFMNIWSNLDLDDRLIVRLMRHGRSSKAGLLRTRTRPGQCAGRLTREVICAEQSMNQLFQPSIGCFCFMKSLSSKESSLLLDCPISILIPSS